MAMFLLKATTVVNWVVIAILAFLVIAETVSPATGGDAAGRGIGQAIYYLAIATLALLLVLNLLPFAWARYTALGIVVVPILIFYLRPKVNDASRHVRNILEDRRPIFEDRVRDQLAKAIRDGEVERFEQLLAHTAVDVRADGELLAYAIAEAAHSSYRPSEKLECVRRMFESGATFESILREDEVDPHVAVADVGNAALLRLLLEQGANANAMQIHFKRPVLFEAIGSHQDPDGTVRVLLEYGADPNVAAVYDPRMGPVTPLWLAARLERWGLCLIFLDHGADPDVEVAGGPTVRELVATSAREFPEVGFTNQPDYDRLRHRLQSWSHADPDHVHTRSP